ncbi:hypothetical protein EMCRGX_G007996 [Ephydatia muelleri]
MIIGLEMVDTYVWLAAIMVPLGCAQDHLSPNVTITDSIPQASTHSLPPTFVNSKSVASIAAGLAAIFCIVAVVAIVDMVIVLRSKMKNTLRPYLYDASFVAVNPQHNEQPVTDVNFSKEAATPEKNLDTEGEAIRLDTVELPLPPPANITSGIVMDKESTCTELPDNTSVSGTGDGERSNP